MGTEKTLLLEDETRANEQAAGNGKDDADNLDGKGKHRLDEMGRNLRAFRFPGTDIEAAAVEEAEAAAEVVDVGAEEVDMVGN